MAENPVELAAGGITIAVAAVFAVYAASVSGVARGSGEVYPLMGSFRSAQGVGVGTDVRLAGLRVGHVTALSLNPDTYRADLAFAIKRDVRVPEDSSVAISTEGLLGGTYVEILPGDSPFELAPGDAFPQTQGARSLISLLAQVIANATSE
ncbi:MAG: MlaD family protein [Pseudomonadota bacterium]